MPRLAVQNTPWPRRILGLAGVASIVSGLVLLPAAPKSLAVTHANPAGHGRATTVHGPRMLNPNSIKPNGSASLFKYHSSVTVSQATNLVNQTIQVSWKGFTPTPPGSLPYNQQTTPYPVVVAECRGAHPKHLSDCFGVAGREGTQGGENQYGPYNAVWTTTTAKGTGVADLPVLSELQNQFLGCLSNRPCSIAVIPVQGGDILQSPFSCAKHLEDSVAGGDTDTSQITFGIPRSGAPQCSWAKRIVVPLHFSPATANCKFKTATLSIIGSPMMQRAMDQWDTGFCEKANPLYITYNFALPEPAAITAVQAGSGDVALTTRPAATLTGAHHKYTYAPVGISAVSVPYWVDNVNTGDPFTNLKLDPDLVAKMLTTSYSLAGVSCTPKHTPNCDSAVDGNPADPIVDPEFTRLNRRINIGDTQLGSASSPNDVPIVQSGPSDMTYMVTRWIAANKDATSFLRGIPDRWGMRVNSYYDNVKYPTDAFVPQDPSAQVQRAYSPIFPLVNGVNDMQEAWPPGTGYRKQFCGNGPKGYCRLTQETPGSRVLFGVLDYADTAAFQIPSAALLNPAGRYVTPSARSMAAAVNSMVDNGNKITQEVSTTSKNRNEYPLTMVIYAMVPTSGESHAKADQIASWLRYVAGAGQREGTAPGTLPVGYLPLTPKLRQQAMTAATEVQNQTGSTASSSSPSPSTSPTSTAGSSTSPSPGSSVSTSPSSSVSFPKIGQKINTVAVRDPQTAGLLRYALPGVLIIGGLAALGGASSLLAPSSGAIAARLRRYYKTGPPWRRKP